MVKPLQKLTVQEKEDLSATIEKLSRFSKVQRTSKAVPERRQAPSAFYGRQVEEDDSMKQAAQIAEKFDLKESFFDYFELDDKKASS